MDENRKSQNEQDYIIAYKNDNGNIIGGIEWSMINEPYRKYLFDDTNVQIFFGGGSSGKSHFVFQRTILDVWLNGRNFLVARQVGKWLESSVYNELVRKIYDFNLQEHFICRKNPLSITCKDNDRQILFIGLDDIEKIKSIVPINGTFTDVIIEEATEVKENSYDQLRIRQRGICYRKNFSGETDEVLKKRITLMFNPISKTHWIYKKFFLGRFDDGDKERTYEEKVDYEYIDDRGVLQRDVGIERISILKTTYRDNMFLSRDDIVKMGTFTGNDKDIYVDGNWGILGKTVYEKGKNWTVEDIPDDMKKSFRNIRNGLDFGGAIDPHAYIKIDIDKEKKTIYIFDEFKQSDLTIDMLWYNIKDKVNGLPVICDRNEDMIKQLRSCGANPYRARKGINSVINGINFLRGYHIIVDRSCRETMYELENYAWKTDRNGEAIEVPIDEYNHLMDALRYACSYEIIRTPSVKTNIDPYRR